ncbi:MAG: M23 family metallopeptidase [Bacteroidales bacterium]|nr:M23 family metallopeptidase [Bacteroidales bacterium]MBN2819636.1 M23 family metallopeptidase [Bacteroidales bacterium]
MSSISAQQFHIQSPIDFPIFLSGNFGELRSTHFHAGIDIKTNGETGKTIRAIEQGYVSRVKIQTGGYGHAIYITHPNGYTSVYGHLNAFYPKLENYVRNQQYLRKSFEVDLYLKSDQFLVGKGEMIGISGNTGQSGGPHLHLEIRDANQVPLNGLKYGLPIEDTIPPQLKNLVVYNDIDQNTFMWKEKKIIPLRKINGSYSIDNPVDYEGFVAFGIEGYDYLNGSSNRCGIYSIDLFIDSSLYFAMQIDKFSFGETKYIKSYCDYEEKIVNSKSVHRLFIEPNNKLSIYKTPYNSGLYTACNSTTSKVKMVTTDVYGNISKIYFTILKKGNGSTETSIPENVAEIDFSKDFKFEGDDYKFEILSNSLFANKKMEYASYPSGQGFYSEFHIFGNENIPMAKFPKLKLKLTKSVEKINPEKLIIARFDTSGKISSEGGAYNSGWVSANVTGFGKYAIVADTIKPEIKIVSFKNNGWYAANDMLLFKISDELSGIKTYNGYIDGSWVLFEYDAKADNLFYKIDPERITKSKNPHELKLFIMDERNNVNSFTGKFYY